MDLSEYGYPSQANERLEGIVEFFWRGGRATAAELAERFNVTKRTINNDIAQLHFLERDGWTYYLPKPYLELQPYEKAEMSGGMMMAMFDKAVPSLSLYSETLFNHTPKRRDIFLFDFAFEAISDEDILARLVSVIDNRRGAQFIYTNNNNETRLRYTYPVKIANFNGYWYLLALDAEADIIKSFRINAMRDLQEMEEDPIGEIRKDVLDKKLKGAVSSWIAEETKIVRLRVEGEAIRYFRRKPYDMICIVDDNGEDDNAITVEVNYFNEIEILRMISKWLPHITIVDDDALKEKMRERLLLSLERF